MLNAFVYMPFINLLTPKKIGGFILACIVALSTTPLYAAYVQRYSTITNGAITFTGNTIGLNKAVGANTPGTNGAIGTFIAAGATTQDGTYPVGTTSTWQANASRAVLTIPAGSVVLYAELIWSGSYSYGGENVSASLGTAVTFATPLGVNSVAPAGATAQTLGTPSATNTCATAPCYYVRSANVTALVQAAGAGTYTVGGIPATQGNAEDNANTGGWTLAVAYQNTSLPSRNLTIFVGAEVAGAAAATVSGFCTPPTGPRSGRLAVSAIEGDSNITGDAMRFGPTAATTVAISGANNPVGNFFASQINGDSGALDTSGTFGTSNSPPGGALAGARQGYDITNVDISTTLLNNQTTAAAQGTTTGDNYMINALGLQINVGAPSFLLTTKAVDKATAVVGDTLTYSISISIVHQ
jgi:large repetitive protein